MAEHRPTASAITGNCACLLLAPTGCDVPGDLLDGLRSRGVDLREVSDAPAVMTELATGNHRIVILIEPGAVRDVEPLTRAMATYHPHTGVWQYSMALDPPLQAYPMPRPAPADVVDREAEGTHRTDPPPAPQPITTSDQTEEPDAMEADELDERPLLTEEELAMLLGDDETETGT